MKLILTFCLFLGFFLNLSSQTDEKKLALIFGNADYQYSNPLKNPVNDADLMASTLNELGFKVIKITNGTKQQMDKAIMEFNLKLSECDVALFYYAGHGVEFDGINYLIPVDAKLEPADEARIKIKYEAINVNRVVSTFEENRGNINIVILDACRNNPFRSLRSLMRTRGGGERGFMVMPAPSGTIISYATAPGTTASDGAGNNGLFTEHLVKQMKKPQIIEEVFKNTRVAVLKASNETQNPQEWSQLTGTFSFIDKKEPVPENTESFVYGNLKFNTELSGDLFLDGGFMGSIKQNSEGTLKNIKAGKHVIEIKGNENWEKEITIVENQTIFVKAQKTKVPTVTITPVEEENINQFKDMRDNKVYKTVTIGNQTWMAENLSYSANESWFYDNNQENGNLYGRLYTWEAANEACPLGWHLPSDDEWKQLETELGMSLSDLGKTNFRGDDGKKYKSAAMWFNNNNGTNEVGFNVLPGGFRNYTGNGSFSKLGKQSFFWSSTEKGSSNAWRRTFHFSNEGISRMNFNEKYAYSVRCIKD